jgi:multidrug efflux system membrane fusion protein
MKRLILVLIILAAAGAWYADRQGWIKLPYVGQGATTSPGTGPANGPRGPRAEPPVPVLAVAVRAEDVPVSIDAVGTVQPLNTVIVRSQVDGRLLELGFADGQMVKKGDLLARIEARTYQAQYDQALAKKAQDEAQLANAKIDLERYSRLAETNFGSRQQADTQKAIVAQLQALTQIDQAAIDNARTILDYATILAPIDGRTGLRAIDVGNIIRASDSAGLVSITQMQPIGALFNLPQQQLRALNLAMARGSVRAQALEADNLSVIEDGRIEVFDNQVDATTGTIKVKASFKNEAAALWPGQFVNIRLYVDVLKGVKVVPTSAVQRGPNGPFVYVVREDATVKKTDVVVGRQDEALSVIESGVELAQKVVMTGFARISDGAKVNAVTPEEDKANQPKENPDAQSRRRQRRGDLGPSIGQALPG